MEKIKQVKPEDVIGPLASSSIIKRHPQNPIFTAKVEDLPYANERLGAGNPPVRTEHGWLSLFHAVDIDPERGKNGWEDTWPKRYTAGVMLQDLEDPRKLVAYSKEPLIAPEAPYEISGGFRNNVIFPGGLIIEDSGEVKMYYGAADTVQCLATAQLNELIDFCLSFK